MEALSESTQSFIGGFCAAHEPPENLSAAEWAERHRVLSSRAGSARPGPWRHSSAPYMQGILEALNDPTVETIVIMMAAQTGKTDGLMLNFLLWMTDIDPGDVMIVLPNETLLDRVIKTRLRPTVEDNPRVARWLAEGKTSMGLKGFSFQRCNWMFASANSPADLSSNPCRFLVMDEIDKGPRGGAGVEGDWIELARERTNNFWNKKIVMMSTPTTVDGPIYQEFLRSDRRFWCVPCLQCGRMGPMERENLKWEKRPEGRSEAEFSGDLQARRVAVWYQCPDCGHNHQERDKWDMNAAGAWVPQGEPGRTRGFQMGSLPSQFFRWNEFVATYYRSRGNPRKMQNFVNSKEGMPYQAEGTKRAEVSAVNERRRHTRRRIVPTGLRKLTAGVDVQSYGYWWSVWGFDSSERMVLVDWGEVTSLREFQLLVMGTDWDTEDGQKMMVDIACVDVGYDTENAALYIQRHPEARMLGVKGAAGKLNSGYFRESKVATSFGLLPTLLLDTELYKDKLFAYLEREPRHPLAMTFPADVEAEFGRQFTAEERVEEEDSKGNIKRVWKKLRRNNHYWDTAVYALAGADLLGFFGWEEEQRIEKARQEAVVVGLDEQSRRNNGGLRMPDGRPYLITERGNH